MAQFQNWLSAERPNAVQSPSLTAAAEIKGRLNFSSVKTPPTALRKLPYSELNTMPNVGNRLGDYHMSKQNPAVIDQLYSPSPTSSPHKNNLYKTASPLFNSLNHSRHQNGSRSGRTQVQTFLRQTLDRRNSLPGGTGASLVHLAIQGRQRKYDSVPVSPVIVRLSGSSSNDSKGVGLGRLEEEETAVNPCDKDVVISALRQKRKRWPTSYDNISPVSDIFPSAKRSRHSSHSQEGPASPPYTAYGKQLPERKRTIAAQADSQALKRAKVALPSALVTSSTGSTHKENLLNRLRVPDIEYESDSETASTGRGSRCDVGPDSLEPDKESVSTGRSNTPILPEEEEDTEIKKKREESLKLQKSLTAVFPSSKSSSRRKLPVFCATGSKPHLPAPLSLTHSATPEDLKKDREAVAMKLKNFLSDEDEEDKKEPEKKVGSQVPVSTSQPPLSVVTATSATTAVLPTPTTSTGLSAPPISVASLSSGIQIPGTLQLGKNEQSASISAAAGRGSASSIPVASASLQKPLVQLTNSSSLTSLTAITTSAGKAAPTLSSSQTGLTSRLPGLSSTGSLPSLQFKAPEQTSSAPKSVSFLLPASTSSPPLIAAPGQGSLMGAPPQPAGGPQFSSAGNGGFAAPGLSVFTTSGSIMATQSTAANSLPAFNFSTSLQSPAPTSTTASSASSLAARQPAQQGSGLKLSGGAKLTSQNIFQSVAGTGEGLFQKAATTSAAPMFSLSSITQQSASSMFSQNKPTLTTSRANAFQGLPMAATTGGSMFPSVPTTSGTTGAKFSFNLANNPFNPSSSTTQGTKELNITSNHPQQGSIFSQNMATGGSNSNTGGLLQNATASNLSSGGLNFNLSAGNPQTGTFNFSAGGTGAKPTLGGLQLPQTQQGMPSLVGGAGAGNQSAFNFSAGAKPGSLGGQPQSTTGTGRIFGGGLASNSASTPFNFSANQQGSTKPTLGGPFSGGLKGSQPTAAAQPPTLNFTGGLSLPSQQPSVFNTGPKQQQGFNFSAGMNSGQGQQQQQQQGFNFMARSGSGQGQNLNQTGGLNFSAGGLGQQQFQNTGTGMFGSNSQQSNIFGTGNGNQTLNQGTGIGVGFQTPQQTGFNFSGSLGNQQQHSTPSFNFTAGTPQGGLGASPAFNFSAGTPGTTPGRAVAKPRRRIKK